MKKMITVLLTALLLCSFTVGPAFAFNDLEPGQKESIMSLKERGIVNGMDDEHFVPQGKISYAQSIQMLVKGLELNIDSLRLKESFASDYFTSIPNDAWYAQAFVIAQLNGLPIPKNVDPNSTITREQFSDLLIHALDTKGSFPVIKMFVIFEDADQIDPQFNNSVQRMILHKFTQLGEDRKFEPKRELTRGEAGIWLYNTIRFIESKKHSPMPQEEVAVSVEKVSDDVNKVTLSRSQKPNAGYGIEINSIRFEKEGRAVVSYTLIDPKPDSMNASVITEPKAETYVSSKYKAVAEPTAVNVPIAQ